MNITCFYHLMYSLTTPPITIHYVLLSMNIRTRCLFFHRISKCNVYFHWYFFCRHKNTFFPISFVACVFCSQFADNVYVNCKFRTELLAISSSMNIFKLLYCFRLDGFFCVFWRYTGVCVFLFAPASIRF